LDDFLGRFPAQGEEISQPELREIPQDSRAFGPFG
jgi:hypothetical protein